MDKKEIVKGFLQRELKNDTYDDDTDLFKIGAVNSLFSMELVLFLEGEFKITVEREDLDLKNFRSVNAIVGFLDNKMSS